MTSIFRFGTFGYPRSVTWTVPYQKKKIKTYVCLSIFFSQSNRCFIILSLIILLLYFVYFILLFILKEKRYSCSNKYLLINQVNWNRSNIITCNFYYLVELVSSYSRKYWFNLYDRAATTTLYHSNITT